eukprot:gene7550-15469_t
MSNINTLSTAIKIFFSVIIFYCGYRLGIDQTFTPNCDSLSAVPVKRIIWVPCPGGKSTKDICAIHPPSEPSFTRTNLGPSVIDTIFDQMYHPGSPATGELILSNNRSWDQIGSCHSMFLLRAYYSPDTTKPPTCIAMARVPEVYTSPRMNIHRLGYTPYPQKLTNQYQDDIIHPHGYRQEKMMLPPLLRDMKTIVQMLVDKLGLPLNEDGSRRTAIVMVANEGVLDIVLNTLCSARAANIDISNQVLFLGQPGYEELVQSMGVHAIYHPSIGDIPASAAGFYADVTFGYLMWLKVISVYVTSTAGFDVLFQDADVVWMRDPLPYLKTLPQDIMFMDDGARSPRFTPFGFNSGFYFMRYNEKTVYLQERMIQAIGEITYTHSHQATLTRYVSESMYLFGLEVIVLEQRLFPSGYMYHKHKDFILDIVEHRASPYVFHMCWTGTRVDKLKYLKEIGMWFLPEESDSIHNKNDLCEKGAEMLSYFKQHPSESLVDKCCGTGGHWKGAKMTQ